MEKKIYMKNLRTIFSLKWSKANFNLTKLQQKLKKTKPNKRKKLSLNLFLFLNKCLKKIEPIQALKRFNKSYCLKNSKKHYTTSKTTYNSTNKIVNNNQMMNNKKFSTQVKMFQWISLTSKNGNNTSVVMEN